MAAAAPYLIAGSTALDVMSTIEAGKAAEREAEYEAQQLESAGTEAYGAGSRSAYLAAREGERFLSDQRAAQAASGGTTTDPQAIRQRAAAGRDIDYNVMNELFKGDVRRQELRKQASATRYGGRQARKASKRRAIGTALGGFGKAFQGFKAAS